MKQFDVMTLIWSEKLDNGEFIYIKSLNECWYMYYMTLFCKVDDKCV